MTLYVMICGNVFSQQYRLLDSLIAQTESAPDSLLPYLYYTISWYSRDVSPVLGMQYALMSIETAEALDNHYCQVMACNMLAINEKNLGKYEEALSDYRTALSIAEKSHDSELSAITYTNMGNAYLYLGHLDSAEYCERTALQYCDTSTNVETSSRIFMNLGLISKERGDTMQAISYLDRSYALSLLGDGSLVQRFSPISELADIYMENGDYEGAKDILLTYLHDTKGESSEAILSSVWYKIGLIYYRMGELDSSEAIMRRTILQSMDLGNVSQVSLSYRFLDSILLLKGNVREAALICRNFIDINDTLFNVALAGNLANIRYSSQYRENKRTLANYEQDRRDRFYMILFAAVILVLLVYAIVRIVRTWRKAEALHVEMESKRASVLDSIRKAHYIQNTMLPNPDKFGVSFSSGFVIYKPRDIVSGDFFCQYYDHAHEMLAVADCTGHGVPGAILTMLGASALQDIALHGVRDAAQVLELLRARVVSIMEMNDGSHIQDGMDITLIVVDRHRRCLDFAGAFNNLVYIRNGEYNVLKATRTPVSKYFRMLPFASQKMDLREGDVFYLATDGLTSQFGGPDGGKYPSVRFRDLLMRVHMLPMQEQKEIIEKDFLEWKGTEDQVDDVTLIGLRY